MRPSGRWFDFSGVTSAGSREGKRRFRASKAAADHAPAAKMRRDKIRKTRERELMIDAGLDGH